MSRFLVVLVAILLVPGCQAKPKTTAAPQAATTPEAATAPDPVLINVVTNQAVVYTCPQCGMDFEGPGQCSMCHVDLVKTPPSTYRTVGYFYEPQKQIRCRSVFITLV